MSERRRIPLGTLAMGGLLILVGLGWLVDTIGAVEVPWGALLPAGLIVVGVALVASAPSGGHAGLFTLGIVLTVLTVATSALDFPLRGGIGERVARPATTSDLETRYDLAIGKLELDLSDLDASPGTTEIEASLGIGELLVLVPADGAIEVQAATSLGDVQVLGAQRSGLDPDVAYRDEGFASASKRISLDLSVGIGSLKVER